MIHKTATNGHKHMKKCQNNKRHIFLILCGENEGTGIIQCMRGPEEELFLAKTGVVFFEGSLAESVHTKDVKCLLIQQFYF